LSCIFFFKLFLILFLSLSHSRGCFIFSLFIITITIIVISRQYDVFMALLEYLYTDHVQAIQQKTVKVEFALDLLSVADQFLVEKLKMLCENSIQKSIDVDNVAHMLHTADQRQAHGLRKKCFEYILRHFGKVIGTQAFSEISKPLLQEVLFAASKRGVHLR